MPTYGSTWGMWCGERRRGGMGILSPSFFPCLLGLGKGRGESLENTSFSPPPHPSNAKKEFPPGLVRYAANFERRVGPSFPRKKKEKVIGETRKKGEKKKLFLTAASRIRTCAGRAHLISSQTP